MPNDVRTRTARVEVIAEIGENHAGDLERAKEMLRKAAAAGANVVKFQSYRGADVADDDPEKEWFGQVELSDEGHRELVDVAREEGVAFLSAPFTIERARLLVEELGLRKVKVASSEMLNLALLDYLDESCETVYISTGLADLDEVREAVSHLDDVEDVVIMHCVTQYPLADEDANLRAIGTLAEAFPERRIGYSDHTIGTLAPVLAVALGATAVEKHFTVDRSLPGTDHELSLLPDELAAMVEDVRKAEAMLGSSEKRPSHSELEIREFVRTRFPEVVRSLSFVQARMDSKRLPGKSLLPVWGEMPLLELVLRRVSAARRPAGVVLATSDNPADDPLADLAGTLGVAVFRGSEEDVLGRFATALDSHPADAVVRVCADNPFVDPGAIDALVTHFEASSGDYASNLTPQSGLPDGTGAEVIAATALRDSARKATAPDEREHVTAYLLGHPERFRISHMPPPDPPWPRLRLDIDTAEDLERMRAVGDALPADEGPRWGIERIVGACGKLPGPRL